MRGNQERQRQEEERRRQQQQQQQQAEQRRQQEMARQRAQQEAQRAADLQRRRQEEERRLREAEAANRQRMAAQAAAKQNLQAQAAFVPIADAAAEQRAIDNAAQHAAEAALRIHMPSAVSLPPLPFYSSSPAIHTTPATIPSGMQGFPVSALSSLIMDATSLQRSKLLNDMFKLPQVSGAHRVPYKALFPQTISLQREEPFFRGFSSRHKQRSSSLPPLPSQEISRSEYPDWGPSPFENYRTHMSEKSKIDRLFELANRNKWNL